MVQKPSMFYDKAGEMVVCRLCPHKCHLSPGQTGICLARKNIDGQLYSLNYGIVTSLALDPIEKKPFNRFYPGSFILSAGSFGCNLKCSFCQNWSISQKDALGRFISPSQLVGMAESAKGEGNIGLAFTYNEPSIWYEYVYDCAKLSHESNLIIVLVTNGYINEQPLLKLLPYIDAVNIDLKSANPEFYKKYCKGSLSAVMDTIKLCVPYCHVEVTTLLIPGENDSEQEIRTISKWLSDISPDIPLHLSRYHPDYKMTEPKPINRQRLYYLADIASEKLNYVYCKNI